MQLMDDACVYGVLTRMGPDFHRFAGMRCSVAPTDTDLLVCQLFSKVQGWDTNNGVSHKREERDGSTSSSRHKPSRTQWSVSKHGSDPDRADRNEGA